jgi:enoyl-CoA hydratase/carnithine racemase
VWKDLGMNENGAGAGSARIRIERVGEGGRIADVRLVRGEKHNALDYAMFEALDATSAELADATDLRAVVISGQGPSFCSGLDFPSFAAEGRDLSEVMFGHDDGDPANLAQRVTYNWLRMPAPVIAALHGNCLGGGSQLALGADIRFAAPDLHFSVLEIKYGLIPDMGITQSLPALVPMDVAKELVWTGRIVEAEEAKELGLVTHLADDPHAAALELAGEIASKSPDAVRLGKRLVNDSYRATDEGSLELEEALQRKLLGSPNQIAAVTAAMTKQPAEFADPA